MKRKKREITEKEPKNSRTFRRRQQKTSIYFLLWTVFSLLSVGVILLFGIIQQSMFVRTYKSEASREIAEKGVEIERSLLLGPPDSFGVNNYNGFVRFLSGTYSVDVLILDETGEVVHPLEPNLKPSSPEFKEYYSRPEELKLLQKKLLEKEGKGGVVYEAEHAYVYGAEIQLYGNEQMYLYVGKSLTLMENAMDMMTLRTVLLAIFTFIVAFAVSSAVAGWFVNPLSELTNKARRLAQGDFNVDFHGNDYGKELVELADSLNFARDELSKTDRMQKELIANVSHDFKTPLTMIKGYASMIMEISGDNPEKRNKHAQIIVDEADRLSSLVSDVLDLSKINAGITQLQTSRINMTEYLLEVLERFAYLRDTQGYHFQTDIDEGLYTLADGVRIGQVLYNLIGNAVNYTGEDKKVYVSLKREREKFRFSVRDTGVGIKQEELSGIWERYYRSSESHKRPVQGTGLGLSIVKRILERHGFLFGVESKEGEGSTFFILFPFAND